MLALFRLGDLPLEDIGEYLDLRRKIRLRRRMRLHEAEAKARIVIATTLARQIVGYAVQAVSMPVS